MRTVNMLNGNEIAPSEGSLKVINASTEVVAPVQPAGQGIDSAVKQQTLEAAQAQRTPHV